MYSAAIFGLFISLNFFIRVVLMVYLFFFVYLLSFLFQLDFLIEERTLDYTGELEQTPL